MTDAHRNSRAGQILAAVTAMCTLLVRQCLGAAKVADAAAAGELTRHLIQIGAPEEIMALATVGMWAGYRPDDDLPDDVLRDVADLARAVAGSYEHEGATMLAAATLALLTHRGHSASPASDLVLAAQAFWASEHHDLALAACRDALRRPFLTPLDEATALMLIARISNDAEDVARVHDASQDWPPDVAAKVDIRSLVVRAQGRHDRLSDRAREATVRGDRCAAAGLMAEVTANLLEQSTRDRDFLEGLRSGFRALSGPVVEVEALRIGLINVVRQVRARQRFGNIPPAARSGLELLILILMSDDNEARESVLAELLEALADAGLSEVGLPMSDGLLPQVVEAELAEKAKHFALWPDLQACVDGLDGNFGLLTRRIGGGTPTAERWITMFISPPSGVLIRSHPLAPQRAAVLDRLNPRTGPVHHLNQAELDDLANAFLHSKAVEMLEAQPARGLVVVPDGPLWSVPWQAASLLRSRPTTIAPSMTLYAQLPKQRLPRIRSVVALIDDTLEDVGLVRAALRTAQDQGSLDISYGTAALDQECDLLLVLAHGAGAGLSFRIGFGAGLTAHDIARRTRASTALVASCGSARTPPVAAPVNLPVSLLMQGCAQCVGGIWLLPQAPTSKLVASTITYIANGRTLTEALNLARAGSANLRDHWGLSSIGLVEH